MPHRHAPNRDLTSPEEGLLIRLDDRDGASTGAGTSARGDARGGASGTDGDGRATPTASAPGPAAALKEDVRDLAQAVRARSGPAARALRARSGPAARAFGARSLQALRSVLAALTLLAAATWRALGVAAAEVGGLLERRTGRPARVRLTRQGKFAIGGVLFLTAAAATVVTLSYLAYTRAEVPNALAARPTVVTDIAGRELGTLRAEAYDPVEVGQLPPHVVQAVLAAEDRSFHDHRGVSVSGTLRAAWANLTAGEVEQGGSTITQQYVGLLTGVTRPDYRQKVREMLVAVKVERQLSKQEILQRYLNAVYLGRGAYGIGAAARTYFGVPAWELDVNQAATLAAMIAQPEELDPAEAPEQLDARRVYTLQGMVEEGWLDPAEGERLIAAGVPDVLPGRARAHDVGAYYLDAVREQLVAEFGERAPMTGYHVVVEMDRELQWMAEDLMRQRLSGQPFTGALVAIDPRDGGVRVLVGGPDYEQQELNTALASRRQAGSAFKPFTLAAFIAAGYSPESRFDAPSDIEVEVPGEDVEVANYGNASFGSQTVREATRTSTNTVYMQLVDEVGPAAVVDLARRAGIRSELPEVPTIALGAGSVTPFEMATAYATFAGGGVLTEPRLIREVRDQHGEVVRSYAPKHTPAIDTRVAQVVTDVLTGVVEGGTGTAADIGRPVAGKTGTTDDYRDAWFAGYTAELAAVVWYGKLDNSPMDGMTGGELPAQTWADFMEQALAGVPPSGFPEPDLSGLEILNDVPPPPPPPPPDQPKPEKPDKPEKRDEPDGGDGGDGDGGGD